MTDTPVTCRHLGDAPSLSGSYSSALPFPHIVLDSVLEPEMFESALKEFQELETTRWKNYIHFNERKYANQELETWGPTLQTVTNDLMSDTFISWLEQLTGINGLIPDPGLDGGGLHRSIAGGFLNVHADFTAHHTQQNWQRRINLLLYLNEDWRPEYGGDLELWERDMSRPVESIAPLGNRMVIFTTTPDAFHGHPTPLTTPPGVARRSLALYYFTETATPLVRSTAYRSRPGDGWRRFVIRADGWALRGYDVMKRRLRLDDSAVSRVLGRLGGSKRPGRGRR